MNLTNDESHPYLPSGEWEGFYCYQGDNQQHLMKLTLTFCNGIVKGDGLDDVDPFVWIGRYDLIKYKIKMDKKYPSHTIIYSGEIDENGIWGTWSSPNQRPENISPEIFKIIESQFNLVMKGGFHIWPKKRSRNKNQNITENKIEKQTLITSNTV